MALIKKFRIKSYKEDETIVEIKNASVFYNKRQILIHRTYLTNSQELQRYCIDVLILSTTESCFYLF